MVQWEKVEDDECASFQQQYNNNSSNNKKNNSKDSLKNKDTREGEEEEKKDGEEKEEDYDKAVRKRLATDYLSQAVLKLPLTEAEKKVGGRAVKVIHPTINTTTRSTVPS